MNAREHALLTRLLDNLRTAANGETPVTKDPEAARLIAETLGANPDASYLLVQRHLLLEMAMGRAQAQIQSLQQSNSTRFLGGQAAPAASNPNAQTNAYGQPIGQSAAAFSNPAAANAAPATASATQSATQSTFGGGSFLGTAAATATGVLGGALLFQGIEHLMAGNNLAGAMPTEEVTNIQDNGYGSMPDTGVADASSGWDNGSMADASQGSAFDDPAADPVTDNMDSSTFDQGGFLDQANNDDSGGGLFDGLFGGGGDDDWV